MTNRISLKRTKTSNMGIDLALDTTLLRDGIKHYYRWDYKRVPHMLVFGATGTGKTHLVKLILARIGLTIPDASVTLCDFKADDFRFCKGDARYYEFIQCLNGLDEFYRAFESRQSGEDGSRTFKLLLFDEWASFLNLLDKKEADSARTKLSSLLMLGRSFNIHVLISQQRADAEYFSKSRDNFGIVIALGNISKESAAMFSFDRDKLEPVLGIGCGYMLTNGTDMRCIQVPAVRDNAKVERFIRKTLL